MFSSECQDSEQVFEFLSDKNRLGNERPWRIYKITNVYLSTAYYEVDEKKADRLQNCAEWLKFRKEDSRLRLHKASFCRVRLCPICQWRRSLKTYAQMSKVMEVAEKDYSFIHLVLTVPNCSGDNLSKTLDKMFYAYRKLIGYSRFKKAVKGFYRGMEVTHNLEADTYHPHFHCLLAVNKSYFTSRDYIKRAEWLELWQKATGDKTITQVHVSKIKNCTAKAIAEVAKYTCKPSDVIIADDWDLTVDTVKVLDKALNKRRFIGLGGVLKDIHKALNLDDIEDGDLTHIEADESQLSDEEQNLITYVWSTGYCQYVR